MSWLQNNAVQFQAHLECISDFPMDGPGSLMSTQVVQTTPTQNILCSTTEHLWLTLISIFDKSGRILAQDTLTSLQYTCAIFPPMVPCHRHFSSRECHRYKECHCHFHPENATVISQSENATTTSYPENATITSHATVTSLPENANVSSLPENAPCIFIGTLL